MELPSPMYLGSGGTDTHFGYCNDPSLNIGGPSLQEMIDSDMKADFDDVLTGNSINFQGMDSLDMLNDLDMVSILDNSSTNGLWSNTSLPTTSSISTTSTGHPVSTHSGLHPTSYASFSNSYLEDLNGSASVMVNPNNVMPLHHPLQHQQVTSLSVNTSLNPHSPQQNSPQSPMPSPMFGNQHQQQQQQAVYTQQTQQRPAKSVRVLPPVSSPMQQVPSSASSTTSSNRKKNQKSQNGTTASGNEGKENGFPKPAYSYSCLIALSLKNSYTGSMSVSEIYKFMCEHFPYFKNAPSGWKNSVRHNLSLNKCFEKIEKPASNGSQRKGCLWAMNPNKIQKMNEEVSKWSRKDPQAIKKGMAMPDCLPALERGEMKKDYNANNTNGADSEDEEDPRTPTSVSSQGSQGYDSAGSDFVDIEGFSQITPIPDSSLPEISLQSGVYDDLGDDRLNFGTPNGVNDVIVTAASAPNGGVSMVTSESFYPASATIRGQYSIAPATTIINGHPKTYHTIVNVSHQPKNH